jgi:hypothetical protein
VDGVFYGDLGGRWSGDASYDSSLAKYSVEFRNFQQQTNEEYSEMMFNVSQNLNVLGIQARRRDLGQNILVWMSWEMLLPFSDTVNKFRLIGSPLVVFNRDSYFGVYSGI